MNAIVPVNPASVAPVDDVWRMAQAVAKSGLFGMKSAEQAMALMLVAQAEGMHPATAARDYHVIQGRPALKADAMLARFMQAGGRVQWSSYTAECVRATFSHPQGGEVEVEWTIEQAKAIGLANKETWRQYPRQMLRARVVSEGIRTVFPGVAVGVYTPEEVADFDERPAVTVTQIEDDLQPTAQPRKSSAQAKKDGDYERLTTGLRACKDQDALKAWGAANADDIGALPHKWQSEIRNEYVEMLQGFKAAAADPAEVQVPVPASGVKAEWEEYVDDVLRCIGGGQTLEEVEEAQRVNEVGIEHASNLVDDAIDRVAKVAEARIAELMAAA